MTTFAGHLMTRGSAVKLRDIHLMTTKSISAWFYCQL